jgi:hypothetical protein
MTEPASTQQQAVEWKPRPPRISLALTALCAVFTAIWCAAFNGVHTTPWLNQTAMFVVMIGLPTFLAFAISLGVFRHRANFLIALAIVVMLWLAADAAVGDLSI